MTDPIAPPAIRYIKLGAGGCWVRSSLDRGEVQFGFPAIPHEPCLRGDWDRVLALLIDSGTSNKAKARDHLREIKDFYTLGADCLWIAFADDHLWWAFADPEVVWLGAPEDGRGARLRRTLAGWRNTDITGRPLRIDALSTKLTQLTMYRQTLCAVHARDYLLRKINGQNEPVIEKAQHARRETIAVAQEMIASLHWAEFEVLVDLIFARTGWQRISRLGGTQKDVDLILREPATGETAFVQVKSRAGRKEFEDYLARFDRNPAYDRMFFVCHSPVGEIAAPERKNVHLWSGERLADIVVKAGLFDWLIEKSE